MLHSTSYLRYSPSEMSQIGGETRGWLIITTTDHRVGVCDLQSSTSFPPEQEASRGPQYQSSSIGLSSHLSQEPCPPLGAAWWSGMPGTLTAQAIIGLAPAGFPVLEASAWADCGLGRLGRLAVVQLLVLSICM
jgi:hypothetical protein